MSTTEPKKMLIVPKDTVIFEPDDINRVIMMFPTQGDAIIFYEYWRGRLSEHG